MAGWVTSPTLEDRIHCVAFVVSCTELNIDSKRCFQKLKNLQPQMNERGIENIISIKMNIVGMCYIFIVTCNVLYGNIMVKVALIKNP